MTEGRITREREDVFRVRAMCPILIVVVMSPVYNVLRHSDVHFEYIQYIVCQLHLNGAVFKLESKGPMLHDSVSVTVWRRQMGAARCQQLPGAGSGTKSR